MNNHKAKSSDISISESGLDFHEEMMLAIFRQFLLAYTDSKQPHWERAFEISITVYGEANGAYAAYGLLRILQAVRSSRQAVFRFVNPCCENCAVNLSDHERHLMRAIRFVGSGDMASAQMEALILCDGFETGATLKAIKDIYNSSAEKDAVFDD
jgi:hypothetical protein